MIIISVLVNCLYKLSSRNVSQFKKRKKKVVTNSVLVVFVHQKFLSNSNSGNFQIGTVSFWFDNN